MVSKDGSLLASPKQTIALRYLIRNVGRSAVHSWKVKTHCGCMVVAGEGVPLPPGASATVEIRIQAPTHGRLKEVLPIETEDEQPQLLGRIPIDLQVQGELPRLFAKPDSVRAFTTDSGALEQQLTVVAIEPLNSEPWLMSWRVNGLDSAEVTISDVRAYPDASGGTVQRRYQLVVRGTLSDFTGADKTGSIVGGDKDSDGERVLIPITVSHRAALRLAPSRVLLSASRKSQRVFLIRSDTAMRQLQPRIVPPQLNVERIVSEPGEEIAFDVQVAGSFDGATVDDWEGNIEFDAGPWTSPILLPVRIEGPR